MFKKMKIEGQLLTGFGVLIAVFGSLLLFITYRMWSLSELTSRMYTHPFTVSNAVQRVNTNIIKIHRTMKDVVLVGNVDEIKKDTNIIDVLEVEGYKDFEIIAEYFLGEREMYEHSLQLFKDWKPIRDEVITLMYTGQLNEAVAITRGKGAQHLEKLEESIAKLNVFALNKASSFLESSESTRDTSLKIMYLLVTAVTISGVIFASMLTRSIMRPITILRNSTIEIGKGNLDTEIETGAKDEIGELASDFNEMRVKLKESYSGLQEKAREKTREITDILEKTEEQNIELKEMSTAMRSLVEDLEVEISAHKLAEKELADLNTNLEMIVKERTAKLEAVNTEIEAFSYSVSHDLRAPLRSIDGFSKILLEKYSEDKLDPTGRDYLKRVRKGAQKMGHLIDDILDLSRISRKEIRFETVDMSVMAQEIAKEIQEREPERKVKFIIKDNINVRGDSATLKILLDNLLSNAWKFTGNTENAEIEFGVTDKDGKPLYFIKDNGAGFDMKYVDKLFGPFQRLHSESDFPGVGIGLAIVKRIIQKHGGSIHAEGEIDKGAIFYFTI